MKYVRGQDVPTCFMLSREEIEEMKHERRNRRYRGGVGSGVVSPNGGRKDKRERGDECRERDTT